MHSGGDSASWKAPGSQPAGPGGLCGSALRALAGALWELTGLRNLASLGRLQFDFSSQSVSSPPGTLAASCKAPGLGDPGSLGTPRPAQAAVLSPTTLLALRLLSLLDFAELLASPGLAGRAAGSAGGSAAAATAGLPCEIPAPTPDSEIAQSPLAGPLAPPPALHSTNKRKACQQGVGGSLPPPQ